MAMIFEDSLTYKQRHPVTVHTNSNIIGIKPGIHQSTGCYRPNEAGGYPDQNLYVQHAAPVNHAVGAGAVLRDAAPAMYSPANVLVNTQVTNQPRSRNSSCRQSSLATSFANENTENFSDTDGFTLPRRASIKSRKGSLVTPSGGSLEFNRYCYCIDNQCLGWKSWFYTIYATIIILVIPLASFIVDVVFYFTAAAYKSASRTIMEDPVDTTTQTWLESTTQGNQTNTTSPLYFSKPQENPDNCLNISEAIQLLDNSEAFIPSQFDRAENFTYLELLNIYDGQLYSLFQPLLIMGGIISIVWVTFYRTTVLLTSHNNFKSTFFATFLYVIFPTITLLTVFNLSEYQFGPYSVQCLQCRYSQIRPLQNSTAGYSNTSSFYCAQNNSPPITLALISIGMKIMDHIASGWVLLCSLKRGALLITNDSTVFETIYKIVGLIFLFFLTLAITPVLFVVPPSVKFVNIILPVVADDVLGGQVPLLLKVLKIIIWSCAGIWGVIALVYVGYVLYKIYFFVAVAKS